ncbi:MAG: glycosyltransferase family 2 protein [Thermoleophilia bacterium]
MDTQRGIDPRVSVIVPAFNEARNLEKILPTLPEVHEVIVVDGGSTDGTAETARRALPGVRVVTQTRDGKGNAMACGFGQATGDILVMFDGDGSADAREIPLMVAALVNGADFVKGSRMLHGGGSADLTFTRSLGNMALTRLVNMLFRTRYTDLCYGYNAFWRDVLDEFDLPDWTLTGEPRWGDGFEIETLLNCRAAAARLTILELPSYEHGRLHGVSNLRAYHDGMRVLRTIRAEWRRVRTLRQATRHLDQQARWSERTPAGGEGRARALDRSGAPLRDSGEGRDDR